MVNFTLPLCNLLLTFFLIMSSRTISNLGYWHQRADERHGNPPQGNQEHLGQRQSWKTPGELGVSKSMECDIFTFSALTLLVG